jgi:uncharacterized protein (DUF1810 family)
MPVDDLHNLERFVESQNPVYDQVCTELQNGRKDSHWMWFVFPQLRGLGHSQTAAFFGIASREEAEAYLNHPVLGPRLLECTQLVNSIEGRSIEQIFGYPDYLKFKSSMSLFACVAPDCRFFQDALDKYFGGEFDHLTVKQI